MSSFDDFIGKYRKDNKCSPLKSECFEAGAQSRQAEVALLQEQVDELKKRVDGVLDYVFGLYSTCDLDTEKLESILKGNQL